MDCCPQKPKYCSQQSEEDDNLTHQSACCALLKADADCKCNETNEPSLPAQFKADADCECNEKNEPSLPAQLEAEHECECHDEDGNFSKRSFSPAVSKIASSASLSSIVSFPEHDLKPNLPISEIKKRLIELIKLRGGDLVQACRNFDRRATSKMQKTHLKQVLRTFCFPITAAQFDALLNELNLYESGKINYMDFFSNLMGGKSIPYARASERLDNLSVDEVELRIKNKIIPILRDVIRSFWLFDMNKDGLIQKAELRRIIKNYCFDLSENLFDDFEQRIKQAALENKDDPAIMGLPLEEVVAEFTNRLYHKLKFLKKTFNVFDCEKNGIISVSDFRGVINFFLMPLSPPLFHQVMKRLGVCLCPDSKVNYKDFLEKFNRSGKKSLKRATKLDCLPIVQHIKNHVLNPGVRLHSLLTSENSEKERSCPIKFSPEEEKYSCLRGDKLKSKFKHHLNKVFKDVEKAIFICDPNQSGFITSEKLKNILKGLCIPLTYEQFDEIICGFRTYGDSLNYREFLNGFSKMPGEDVKKWVATVNKLVTYKSRCAPELPFDEAEEMLRECVQSRRSAMLNDFKILDVCNVGVICKDDVRNVLNKFSFRFNDKQFYELWKKLPRNKFDQLLYNEFLEKYSLFKDQDKLNAGDSKDKSVAFDFDKPLHETSNDNLRKKNETINRKSAKDILFSQAPHLKKMIESIEPAIIRNIRTIRYYLNRSDPKLSGSVDFNVLIAILEKSGIRLSTEEEFYILEYFDCSLRGKINYKEFLQVFVWYA